MSSFSPRTAGTAGTVLAAFAACIVFSCATSESSPPYAGAADGVEPAPDGGGDAARVTLPGPSAPSGPSGPSSPSGPSGPSSQPDAATGPDGGIADPNAAGPFAYTERDANTTIAATGDTVGIHVAYPNAAGPFPVVVFGHGLLLKPDQYYSYLKRLASFGYVALTVDFPGDLTGNDNPKQAKDIVGGIDWAKAHPTIGSKVDATKVGLSGHSLGGKLALLGASLDARVKASFVLDPIDSGGGPNGCTPPTCVVVKGLMSALTIPTGFLGETTDATGAFVACAPAPDNFTTFYTQAKTPSLQITAIGANHLSFLDDESTCGLACVFCNAATAPNARVSGMARALMVAFYERHLRGNAAYDSYLNGAVATARYVKTNQATILSK